MQRKWLQHGALLVVVLFALTLRLYDLKDLPAGLFCDEAAMGYNAYAIGNYGIDENGRPWPLFIWSFAGYKNPLYIYAAAIPVRLFGLDEFTTRLPAVFYGAGTVIAVFYLGRALIGPGVGLLAALLLTLCPWHIHFSRIAFELISFPFLVTIGTTLLVRYSQGRRTLPAALFFFALTPYSYAISGVFVPLFLAGFGLLYLPSLLRRWKQTLLAFLVMGATLAPAGVFYSKNFRAGGMYVQRTSWVEAAAPLRPQVEQFVSYYRNFFSPGFLFERGDPITRHAVRGFGELLPLRLPEQLGIPRPWTYVMLGLLLLGGAVALFAPLRAPKLLLWWLLLYPVGASVMNEIPSATRSFVGVPAFCLLAALGIWSVLRALGWVGWWRPLGLVLQAAALGGLLYLAGMDSYRYLDHYFREYPKYSAPTPGGFQYGFRDLIGYMDGVRDQYDLLMISTTDGNQQQIFPLFYRALDPRQWIETHDPGYLVLDPTEYRRYSMDQRVLYALQRSDLDIFSDYTIKRSVIAPGGQEAFLIAEVRDRKRFLTDWLVLGPFDNKNGQGVKTNFIDVTSIKRERYQGVGGEVSWRRIQPQFVRVDLNQFFATSDPRYYGNPEYDCAYAMATVSSPQQRQAFLELGGSDDFIQVWLNGRMLTPGPMMLGSSTKRRPIELAQGANLILIKSCESIGSWHFTTRITDEQGRDLSDLVVTSDFPRGDLPMPAKVKPPAAPVQLVEGFASIVKFSHTQDTYADYRGGTESWWAYARDLDGEVVWRTAPCPVRETTTLAFTGSMGEEPGQAELWINGQYVLTFDLDNDFASRTWQRGPYQLSFSNRQMIAGNSGIFLLTVPAEAVQPGEPLEIRVVPIQGQDNGWFMVKGYGDTVAFENLTPQGVVELVRGDWKDVD